MEVQTYEVTEHTTEGKDSFEIDAESKALVDKLGLDGQQNFYVADAEDETISVIPYRTMTIEEIRVYQTIFPDTCKLAEYKECPIPLRVLQVAAHAQILNMTMEVWYPRRKMQDPILVAQTDDDTFLLARWGEALESFETLREKALTLKVAEFMQSAREGRESLAKWTEGFATSEASKWFGGGYVYVR